MTLSFTASLLSITILVILFTVPRASTAAGGPRRSLLRALDDGADPMDAAVDLNSTTFDAILKESSAKFAVVEFFAHWCPACRNYKSHYEKVARLFNGPDAVHPGIIIMARVDCATKMNTDLCDRFSVAHFPMLLWGSPHKFASGRWDPKQEKNDIQPIDDGRTADRLLNWINKQIGSSFSLNDVQFENEHTFLQNASDPELIARAIYDVEEATTEAFDIIVKHKMIKSDTRAPLIMFFQLLATHHPSRRCRRGTADLLVNFDDLWPSSSFSISSQETSIIGKDALKGFWICGKDVPRGYWTFCRGSKNETRGFSCGLWVLLHSLSVRVGDGESHTAFTTMCNFIKDFFICDECRRHFYSMCSSVNAPLNTTRSLALWLWDAHNKVNERLMKEEKDLETGDPRFPKIIWPSKQLCSSCYRSSSQKRGGSEDRVEWNEDEVLNFLAKYYGEKLVSTYKDATSKSERDDESAADDVASSTNSVAVPVGAALGIALASCTFGALACFWRAQQKNRKYLHHLHSLKNI